MNETNSISPATKDEAQSVPMPPRTEDAPQNAVQEVPVESAIEALLDSQTAADLIFDGGPGHVSIGAASDSLAGQFDGLMQNVDSDDRVLLIEGRAAAAELLLELQVPVQASREIASTLGEWSARLHAGTGHDEETLARNVESSLATLRADWGNDFDAKLALARRAFEHAAKKAPWLRDVVEAGAGNDAKLIKHFADIGLRQAKRTRKAK